MVLSLSLLILIRRFNRCFFTHVFGVEMRGFCLFFPPTVFGFGPGNDSARFNVKYVPLNNFYGVSKVISRSVSARTLTGRPRP